MYHRMNDMASSSPVSFRSQAHNHSPTQVSDQDFRSQVPFYTQLPYDRSPFEAKKGQNLPPVPKPTPKCLPRTSKVSTKSQDLHTSRPRSNASSGKEFSDAQDLYQSLPCRVNVSDNQPATVPGEVEDEDEVISSDESIECVPLGTNLGRLDTELPVEDDAVDLPMPKKQPFPLVEWIRRIREESKSEWPTLPLKWSRSISKQQRKILDDEDAWYPPLPGRPVRQGTIPIDILKELTLQVDQDAERKANEELHHSLPHPSRTSDQHPTVSQPQDLPSSPPSPSSVDETAVPWSSSPPYPPLPPRRQLPPDTSPPRPASNREQQFTTANEILPEASQDIPLASKPCSYTFRKAAQSTPGGPDRIRSTQKSLPARREGAKEANSTNRVSRSTDTEAGTPSQERPRTSPLREDLPLTSSRRTSRLPETVPRSRPKIQVKDTPFPAKGLARDRGRFYAEGYIPESSLVPATYPEAAMAHQRKAISPERDSSSLPHSQPARMTAPQAGTQSIQKKSQPAERQLKRTFDKVDQEAHTAVAQPVSSHSHEIGSNSNRADNGQPERQPDKVHTTTTPRQARQSVVLSPTTSEYKAEEEVRVRNKELLDQERLENRRAFRASIATSITRGGVKYVPASTPKPVDENTRAISAALSSPKSHGPTLAGSRSEGGETSATNLSLHDTSRPTKPPNETTSRQTSVKVPVNTGGLGEVFQIFIRAYPKYLGSFKIFESALKLLVELRSKPREPHPSLWDDFVFRMADDYKAYLQECIEEGESALSYQDFYYLRVKHPERQKGVITEEDLKIVTSSTTKLSTPLKGTSSNMLSHDDVIMIDADTPKSQRSRVHTARPSVETAHDLEGSRDYRPPSRAAPTPVSQKPDKVPTNEPSTERVHTNKTTKRQSMPWSTNQPNKSLTDTVMLQTQQILASSGEQTNSTTVVEQWLSRPAGACSPEIELTQIQAPDQDVTIAPSLDTNLPKVANKKVADRHVQDSDLLRLHLPKYLASQKATSAKDTNNHSPDPQPSITASDITAAQAERPVTPFTMFARNFANLQSEKELRGPPGSKKKLPINVYKW